ncbi:MAG: hypothetical protein R3C09_14695 [Pirellulaceae bacterium]
MISESSSAPRGFPLAEPMVVLAFVGDRVGRSLPSLQAASKATRRRQFANTHNRLGCMLVALTAFTVGCERQGSERYPVKGQIIIDGLPAERVMVQFHLDASDIDSGDRYPVALTDANGNFSLGDQSQVAGAVEGTYHVTFSWLSSADLDAVDKLKGKYAALERSAFSVKVPLEEPLRFELKSVSPKR